MITRLWTWFSGKKTVIASIYWGVVMPALAVWYPEGVPVEVNKPVVIIGLALTAAGAGHKAYKKISEG